MHGQAYSETGQSIYLSPSIEYAAFPIYGQFFQLGVEHWAQTVLKVRAKGCLRYARREGIPSSHCVFAHYHLL